MPRAMRAIFISLVALSLVLCLLLLIGRMYAWTGGVPLGPLGLSPDTRCGIALVMDGGNGGLPGGCVVGVQYYRLTFGGPSPADVRAAASMAGGPDHPHLWSRWSNPSYNFTNAPRTVWMDVGLVLNHEAFGGMPFQRTGLSSPVSVASQWWFVGVPWWLAVLLTAVPPATWLLWFRGSHLRRRRLAHGLCVACGYDLRGTIPAGGAACPECGAAIPTGQPTPETGRHILDCDR
jgi:hypothetical protein